MADVNSGKRSSKKKKTAKRSLDENVKISSKKAKIKEEHLIEDDDEHEDEDEVEHKNEDAIAGWQKEELNQLIDNITQILPKNDCLKYTTTLVKLNWEEIKFGRFDAEQCKAAWKHILTRIRRYRTMTEITRDAKDWAKRPWSSFTKPKQKHPDLPKKPLTPFFRFFLEQRPKIPQTLSTTDMAKFVSKKFAELPDKKKKKYKDAYVQEMTVYREKLERFISSHPEEALTLPKSKQIEGPEKPHTPFDLFKASKTKEKLAAGLSKKEALEDLRKAWQALSDSKRIKWIRKSLSDEVRYHAELQEYLKTHPNFQPPVMKTLLTKAEKELKDKCDGKPERPPPSGYNLYSRKVLKTLDGTSKEKMVKIAQMWKDLSDSEKAKYNFEAKKASTKYIEEFENYLNSLPMESRAKALLESRFKVSGRKMKTDASGQVVGKKSSPKEIAPQAVQVQAQHQEEDEEEDDDEEEEDEDENDSDEEEDSDSE